VSGPSQYVRQKREAAARRRLEIAKMLRDDPTTTNKQLAKVLNVNRDTVALDRKIMVEALHKETQSETELLRADMLQKLESLHHELELHRRDGKLPVSVIHEGLLVTRSIIELLGVRKPVVETLEVKKSTVAFRTTVVRTQMVDGKAVVVSENKGLCGVTRSQLALKAGDDEGR